MRFALVGSWILLATLAAFLGGVTLLARAAQRSRSAFVRSFLIGWRLTVVVLLIMPLLSLLLFTYVLVDLSMLVGFHGIRSAIQPILIAGCSTVFFALRGILRQISASSEVRGAREVLHHDAPALWDVAITLSKQMSTDPPSAIIVGLDPAFFISGQEIFLRIGDDTALSSRKPISGKILCLSYPLLSQLTPDEASAVIAHELAHSAIGDLSFHRAVGPTILRAKTVYQALHKPGGLPFLASLPMDFFGYSFREREFAFSREAEIIADRRAAELVSAQVAANALAKVVLFTAALNHSSALDESGSTLSVLKEPSLLPAIARERILLDPHIWNSIFEARLTHPFQSHPSLHSRLEALQEPRSANELRRLLSIPMEESAADAWGLPSSQPVRDLFAQAEREICTAKKYASAATVHADDAEKDPLLTELFPPVAFASSTASVSLSLVIGCVMSIGFLSAAWLISEPVTRLGAMAVGLASTLATWNFKRNHLGARLVVDLHGITHTGWNRRIGFNGPHTISAREINPYGSCVITISFPTRVSRLWKATIWRGKVRSEQLSLDFFGKQKTAILETIRRYAYRLPPGS